MRGVAVRYARSIQGRSGTLDDEDLARPLRGIHGRKTHMPSFATAPPYPVPPPELPNPLPDPTPPAEPPPNPLPVPGPIEPGLPSYEDVPPVKPIDGLAA